MARKKQPREECKGREQARKLHPLKDTCEAEGCERPAVDRHHIDENPNNNAPENIKCLCRKCHLLEHDLITKLHEARRTPPRECERCGTPYKKGGRGRCNPCYEYLRRNGHDNPNPRKHYKRKEVVVSGSPS